MSRSSGPSTADELVEQGYRRANDSITRMFTRALERNPGADSGDVLQMALRKYPTLRRKQKSILRRDNVKACACRYGILAMLTCGAFSSSQRNVQRL